MACEIVGRVKETDWRLLALKAVPHSLTARAGLSPSQVGPEESEMDVTGPALSAHHLATSGTMSAGALLSSYPKIPISIWSDIFI